METKYREIHYNKGQKNGVNRLNLVQKATNLKKQSQKWEEMKCRVTVKTATDQWFLQYQRSSVQLVLKKMDRNTKLRATSKIGLF